MRILWSILLVVLLVPAWSGSERLPLLDRDTRLRSRVVPIELAQRQIGALTLIGAIELTSDARAFGGFSAISIRAGRVTLLNDGGNWISFAIRRGRIEAAQAGFLGDGPATGWEKRDRDSESLAVDPVTGTAWIGFENANAIWRYSSGLVRGERFVRPAAMRRWPLNGGAETLVRLRDGRFVVLAERGAKRRYPKPGLIFARDPTSGVAPARFAYRPPAGYDPTDAVELPDGDLLVLNRRFEPPYRFAARIVRVRRGAIRAGAVVRGREIAVLGPPSLAENWEGITVTREGEATMVWLVSDEDAGLLQRTLLAKFRLRT